MFSIGLMPVCLHGRDAGCLSSHAIVMCVMICVGFDRTSLHAYYTPMVKSKQTSTLTVDYICHGIVIQLGLAYELL
jgi:hypothetical protein